MDVLAVTVARGDAIGYALLLLTVVFAVFGYLLSNKGLNTQQAATVTQAAQQAKVAATNARGSLAQAQTLVAQGASADQKLDEAVNSVDSMTAQMTAVDDALGGLTGSQAPARAMWALGSVSLLAALISFDLINGSVG